MLDSPSRSGVFESEPVGFLDQPRFWNAAIAGRSELTAPEFLSRLKQIESSLGRQPRFRNGPRELDLDLLLLGDEVRGHETVELPHPRLLDRPFALLPAAEVAGDLVHPAAGCSLRHLAQTCTPAGMVRIAGSRDWESLPRS